MTTMIGAIATAKLGPAETVSAAASAGAAPAS
jgi:hypothetical protein